MNPPLVIGYGNTLRADDAAGVLAAQQVRDTISGVDVIITHDIHPEIAESLSHRDLVIFLDAAAGTEEVVCSTLDLSSPVPPVDSHLFSPSQVLALCKSLYGTLPRAVYLVAIPAFDFSFTERLSPATKTAIDESVKLVKRILDERQEA